MRRVRGLITTAAVAAVAALGVSSAHAQNYYTPTQAQLEAYFNVFGSDGVINSITPDSSGGVIVNFTFGDTRGATSPQQSLGDEFSANPGLNLSGFTGFQALITLLPGSGTDGVDLQGDAQDGNGPGGTFHFDNLGDLNPVSIAGGQLTYTGTFDGTLATGNIFALGFQIFPPGDTFQPPATATDSIQIDPDPADNDIPSVPEPATLGLAALSLGGLLMRRRRTA